MGYITIMYGSFKDHILSTVDSKKSGYEPGTIYASFPSTPGFGVGRQSYSNFLAATVV